MTVCVVCLSPLKRNLSKQEKWLRMSQGAGKHVQNVRYVEIVLWSRVSQRVYCEMALTIRHLSMLSSETTQVR